MKRARAEHKQHRSPSGPRVRAALARARRRQKQRGIALIMVLGAITILTVFLTELQTDTTSAVAGALAERDRLKAEYYAKSAVNLSRMLLASEKPIRLAIGPILQLALGSTKAPQIPIWEFSDRVLGAFNGGDKATLFGSTIGADLSTAKNLGIPGNGYYELVIVDEDSKININSAASPNPPMQLMPQFSALFMQPQYMPLFEAPDADGQQSDAATLCSSLIDWADPDENLTNCADITKPAAGSEDNIYQMLGLGYIRKNAPFDSLEEMRLVRGMDDDRWATFVDPDPSDPHKRVMTVWGQVTDKPPINVNTAPPIVLLAVVCSMATIDSPLCSDPLQQAAALQIFTMVRSFGRGVPIFPSWLDFSKAMEGKGIVGQFLGSMGVSPVAWDPIRGKRAIRRKLFKTESKIFSIYAEGVVPGQQREARVRIHAVVDMRGVNDWNQQAATDPNDPTKSTVPPAAGAPAIDEETAPIDQDFVNELKTNPFGSVVYYRVD